MGAAVLGLNPFMNQVYFYAVKDETLCKPNRCLNPFMNQVYFYDKDEKEQ